MARINYFEGSYSFKGEDVSTLSMNEVKEVLAAQYKYNPTDKALWAEVMDGKKSIRFVYDTNKDELKLKLYN